MSRVRDTLKHAFNIFSTPSQARQPQPYYGASYSSQRPDRLRFGIPSDRSIRSAIYTRLCVDVSSVEMRHVRLDDQRRYLEDIDSGLNNCLTLEANIDQAARHFRQDIVETLFECGVAAIVPVDTSINPNLSSGFDILTLRVGKITQWFPKYVRVSLYNEDLGFRQEVTVPKSMVAIVENPLFSVMNEQNSTLQMLLQKISLLDAIDNEAGSGKLDLIIQLPYTIKSPALRERAEQRRTDIEFQLTGSKYGIAYADGTEKITQLNRPVENTLPERIDALTAKLYAELGLTETVMNGTADEPTMINYWNRTIEPVLTAIVEEFRRKFLTKTARSQKQWVMFFRDPFKLVPIADLAEIADKFTRNEIMTSNEIRQVAGMRPHQDPKADQLINSNMPVSDTGTGLPSDTPDQPSADNPAIAAIAPAFDSIDSAIDQAFSDFGV